MNLDPTSDARFSVPRTEFAQQNQRFDTSTRAWVKALASHCSRFSKPIPQRAGWQLASTLLLLSAVASCMFATVNSYYAITLMLALPGAGLLVRCFIIQHDCGHGSFLNSPIYNKMVGVFLSVLTLTPYSLWSREHAQHHASTGHLDRRGVGDINTITVAEYRRLRWERKIAYRIYRNPFFLFGLGVPVYFALLQRLPWGHGVSWREAWKSVMGLNISLIGVYSGLGLAVGFQELFWVAWPMLHIATAVGGWLFFIQHQFEHTYWEGSEKWSFQEAAILSSSYYVLPSILNWFTGHIGLHHIHHLNSKIPNYRLRECLDSCPDLQSINRIDFKASLACAKLKLWDESSKRLVTFDELIPNK